ncbi:MAG TPA: Gfo/Idh/MocA family oxidoreductase, partial [Bryobacteraceae bacterium]|nr:Gfo/Idh/MocA family oxidoreductase [Bryobacteraceae bacterium]
MPDTTNESLARRDFLRTVTATGVAAGAVTSAFAARPAAKASNRVIGANDRINIGVIGCGGRGTSDARSFATFGENNPNSCQVVAVADVYEKRRRTQSERHKVKGYLDYRELLNHPELDAVVIATPDHWH